VVECVVHPKQNVTLRNGDELHIFPMETIYVSRSPKLGHGWVHLSMEVGILDFGSSIHGLG
jgi:hypothetical protein